MLFNSYSFLVFLAGTLVVYRWLQSHERFRAATAFLGLMSLIFYGWWSTHYLIVLLVLMSANFVMARWLASSRRGTVSATLLGVGVTGNLAVLGYFKYTNFLVDNLNAHLGLNIGLSQIVLPLGISFFTFQKIALLVDAYRGQVKRLDPLGYGLFVTFFPQLIAGPIVHHSEVVPQFTERRRATAEEIAQGLTIFVIGLSKKVLLADTLAAYATPVFDSAASGTALSCAEAWYGTLAYTLQLYFDFSGYSDMAVGAALLFGIRLPLNFASPYKARSIVEFWRRWHMTLSRFLRDYLYIPLGGSHCSRLRHLLNLLVTMALGGLWHGAGWTFLMWGVLHGLFLVINHLWRSTSARLELRDFVPLRGVPGAALTFLAVAIAWIFFRAADVTTALSMLQAMAGFNGLLGASPVIDYRDAALVIVPLLGVAWLAPNTQQITGYCPDRVGASQASRFAAWRPGTRWAVGVGALLGVSVLCMTHVSEFLYFQF